MMTPAASKVGSGAGSPRKLTGAPQGSSASFLSTEGHRGHHGGPAPVLAAFGGGGDVHGADDVAREQPLLAPGIPGLLGIERHAEHGGEHRRREILGVVARDDLVLPVAVMLR